MIQSAQTFDEIVNKRRSVRLYDKEAHFDETAVQRSLERAVLSPNSSNMQLWEFYRVKSEDKKKQLAEYCLGQPAAGTANELIVFVTRKDLWKKRQKFNLDTLKKAFGDNLGKREKGALMYYEKIIPALYMNDIFRITSFFKNIATFVGGLFKPMPRELDYTDNRITVHKSCGLAAQTFMLSIAAEGYDSCPMEGYDSSKVKSFLNLPWGAEICMVVGVGKARKEGIYGPRYRVPNEEVIFEL